MDLFLTMHTLPQSTRSQNKVKIPRDCCCNIVDTYCMLNTASESYLHRDIPGGIILMFSYNIWAIKNILT